MVQALTKPLSGTWALVIRLRAQLSRGLPRVRIARWKWVRSLNRTAYWVASSPSRILAKSAAQSESEDRSSSTTRKLWALLFRASLLEPARWMISFAGLVYRWTLSRPWPGILLRCIPSCVLLVLLLLVWQGGRLSKMRLAQWYFKLGEAELVDWESNVNLSSGESLLKTDSALTGDASSNSTNNDSSDDLDSSLSRLSPYGEMLFRRIHLLQPNNHSRFVIALTYLQHGAEQEALHSLQKLAPDNERGDPRAHGILAALYLKQISQGVDETLLPLFLHHAIAGAGWSKTPSDVLVAASDILWKTEREEQAVELLQLSASRRPELHLLVYQRSMAARLPSLAESARQKGIERFESMLIENPENDFARIQLALLEFTKPDGLGRAEELLKQNSEQNPLVSRALSNIYLKRFEQEATQKTPQSLALGYLDKALVADPSNPKAVDRVTDVISGSQSNGQHLLTELKRKLVSGSDTTGTHALFAEYYISKEMTNQALLHLEQVVRSAPTAAKYANQLVVLYMSSGRLDEAFQVANRSLTLLKSRGKLGEKYADELLESLGKLYEGKEEIDEAIRCYELILALNSGRSDTRYRLAELYRVQGRHSEAEQQESLAEASKQFKTRQQAFLSALADPSSSVLKELRTSFREYSRENPSSR